ncbi:MAG: membrane lipoprotein lipid attachment site-containing protein [Firmicutes bacterium]|nr:membrane lipoprotein lipid attachment site-containing protein [Bacillota bacterium]
MKKIILGAMLLFMLAGCANRIVISEEDALEVCLDAAGYKKEEVRNSEVKKEDGYMVKFISNTNDYTFKVDENGIIKSRNVEALPESKVIKEEEEKVEEESESPIDAALEEKIVDNSLANWGVNRSFMKEYTIEKDPNKENVITVHITLNDGRKFATVTTEEGKLISSYNE